MKDPDLHRLMSMLLGGPSRDFRVAMNIHHLQYAEENGDRLKHS